MLEHLDRLLAPYGGLGAVSRDDQLSHRYLSVGKRSQGQDKRENMYSS